MNSNSIFNKPPPPPPPPEKIFDPKIMQMRLAKRKSTGEFVLQNLHRYQLDGEYGWEWLDTATAEID